jgi:hypothetical protein
MVLSFNESRASYSKYLACNGLIAESEKAEKNQLHERLGD